MTVFIGFVSTRYSCISEKDLVFTKAILQRKLRLEVQRELYRLQNYRECFTFMKTGIKSRESQLTD